MKVYDLQNDKGNISALILVEEEEIRRQACHGEEEALTRAINDAVMSLAQSTGQTFQFTRILSYDEQEDGAVMVWLETAAAPKVTLGRYRGLSIPAMEDPEAFADRAVELAAQGIDAEVPALIVERELDALLTEKRAALLQDIRLNLLTDIGAILEESIRDLGWEYRAEELWAQAAETVELYFDGEKPGVSMDRLVSAAADVLARYGAVTQELCMKLARLVEIRMDEREKLTGEELAGQVFECYLKAGNTTMEQWREQNRPEALARTRKSLTLDAVADAEGLSVGDDEVLRELERLGQQYELTPEQVREIVGEDALRFHMRRDRARRLIADSALCEK